MYTNRGFQIFRVFILIISLLAVVALSAYGQGRGGYVQIPVASKHFVDGEYNEFNPGLIAGVSFDSRGTFQASHIVGGYYNSHKNVALVFGNRFSAHVWKYFRANLSVGVVTGYGNARVPSVGPGIAPMFVQSIEIGPSELSISISHVSGAVGFGLITHF